MDDNLIQQMFGALWSDITPQDNVFAVKPLLAHYTSLPVMEQILRNNEIWLSNPLFMTDLEEVRFGMFNAQSMALASDAISAACGTPERADLLKQQINGYFNHFSNEHAIDTYILCLSEHPRANEDGALSMWRGYGSNGNGAAIVIDTGKMNELVNSPLILAKVHYGSNDERLEWINQKLVDFASILSRSQVPDDKLQGAAFWLFERLKQFALFSKHHGFREEQEWRVVYMRNRDPEDRLKPMFGYSVGPRGVEPKLKLKIEPIPGSTFPEFSLEQVVDRIILGPSMSSPLVHASVCKMLDHLGRAGLKDRLRMSTIPFRPHPG